MTQNRLDFGPKISHSAAFHLRPELMRNCCRAALLLCGGLFLLLSGAAAFSALPSVRIMSANPVATESGTSNAAVTILRTGAAISPLTVEYTITGSAVSGRDFFRLPGRATIPAGAQSVTFPVQ